MAAKAWMKKLGVQGWIGLRHGAQGLKETCQLGGINSLVSHGEISVNDGWLG